MALVATVVSPPVGTDVSASDILTVDVVGGDTWIAAQFNSSTAVEVVYDGTDFTPRFALSAISAITGGARYAVRRVGGWPTGGVTLRYYDMAGGVSDVASPFVDKEVNSNSSGAECIALQLPFDGDNCPATIAAKLAIIGGSSAGTGIFRAYIGGTHGNVDDVYVGGGTFVGSITVSIALDLIRMSETPIVNPGGLLLLTVTYESSAPGASITKYGLTGVVA